MALRPNPTLTQLAKIRDIEQDRPLRSSTPTVLVYEGEDVPLLAEGSVTIFFARRGSAFLKQARSAFRAGKGKALEQLTEQVWDDLGARRPFTVAQAAEAVAASGVSAELRYGGKQLANGLVLPEGIEWGAVPLAYNGGELDLEAFRLIEHHLPDSKERLEALVVVRPPQLTELERKAVSSVPADMLEMNLTTMLSPGFCVALVLVITVLTAMGKACGPGRKFPHLTDEQVRELGPQASARELLALRREAFQTSPGVR
jgi:hypothetical protein